MKEKLQEIYEGLKERLRSPFILTFLLVWSVHHWDLLFHLVTFDEDSSQIEKYNIVKQYVSGHGWWELFWWPVICSGLSFIGYLIAALIFESISELYEKWGRPLVYYIFNTNKIVRKEELTKMKTEYDYLNSKYEELDKANAELQDDYGTLKVTEEANIDQLQISENENESINKELHQLKVKLAREDDYIYNKTRKAIYQVFEYDWKETRPKTIKIKLQSLFLGKWSRTEYPNFTLEHKESEHELNFQGENVTDVQNVFIFNVTNINKIDGRGIFIMEYKTRAHLEIQETLFKISDELIIGRIDNELDETFRLVEYRKINS